MTVAIILATLNGAAYLQEQLESIARQTTRDWHLWVTDDGSSDHTLDIVDGFAKRHPGQISRLAGPRCGSAANFLTALSDVPDDIAAIAFCDQDDVWHPEKLSAAVRHLHGITDPMVYFGRQIVTTADLQPIGLSQRPPRPIGFRNALVQNVVSGNVAVLNQPARRLIIRSDWNGAVHHDWLAYQIVTGAGGRVIYDDVPRVLYRQHANNSIGASQGASAWLKRYVRVRDGRFARELHAHVDILSRNRCVLNKDNQSALAAWQDCLTWEGTKTFARLPVYRQSVIGQAALRAALVMGWLSPNVTAYGSRNASCDLYSGRIR